MCAMLVLELVVVGGCHEKDVGYRYGLERVWAS